MRAELTSFRFVRVEVAYCFQQLTSNIRVNIDKSPRTVLTFHTSNILVIMNYSSECVADTHICSEYQCNKFFIYNVFNNVEKSSINLILTC